MARWDRFEAGIETHAKNTLQALPFRLAGILGLGLILGWNFSLRDAAIWIACAFVSEAWSYLAWRKTNWAAPTSETRRWQRILSTFAASLVWTAAGVIYWWADSSALDAAAVVLLTTLLINAQSISPNSFVTSIAFGFVPTIALITFPFTDGFQPAAVVAVLTTVAMSLSFLVINLRQSIVGSAALREAKAALEEQTARADAANRAKSAFLAMMSHELRTPMNGVLGMAHALRQTALDPRQDQHVDMLIRSGDGLMTILNDILDISKIEAGKLEIETIPMDLSDVAARVRDLWSEAASAKGVRLLLEVDETTPKWVAGDPTRLRQVMTNLVSNALKFTPSGKDVRLAVRPTAFGDGRVSMQIVVSDTGIGMTEAGVARLFQAFSQAEVSTARKFGGTGLGLAICKQLVELMGGEITVESAPGEGSTFRVNLTMVLAEAPILEAEGSDADITGRGLLVVDDNPINLAVARAILEAVGAEVATAGDGLAALEMLKTNPFDAVLMDLHMPRLDGVQTLARIRGGDAGPSDMPVIVLSADAMDGVERELLALGFDAVQTKPIRPAALIWCIASVCSPRKSARAAVA
jgi:signal transduction histidine kinase